MKFFKRKERGEIDNDALPPLLKDEVKHERQSVRHSTIGAGRDVYAGSKITKVVRAHLEMVLVVLSVVLSAALVSLGVALGVIQSQRDENAQLQRSTKQTIDLQRENFADFIRLVYNPLAAKVEADHFIIEYLGLEKASKQEKDRAKLNADHH